MSRKQPHRDPWSAKTRRRRRRSVIRRDGGICRKCGSDENLTLDHIVPSSEGGSARIENLQLLCFDCNQAKGAGV